MDCSPGGGGWRATSSTARTPAPGRERAQTPSLCGQGEAAARHPEAGNGGSRHSRGAHPASCPPGSGETPGAAPAKVKEALGVCQTESRGELRGEPQRTFLRHSDDTQALVQISRVSWETLMGAPAWRGSWTHTFTCPRGRALLSPGVSGNAAAPFPVCHGQECGSPNSQYLRMCPYLEIGSLEMRFAQMKSCWRGPPIQHACALIKRGDGDINTHTGRTQ